MRSFLKETVMSEEYSSFRMEIRFGLPQTYRNKVLLLLTFCRPFAANQCAQSPTYSILSETTQCLGNSTKGLNESVNEKINIFLFYVTRVI